VLYVSAEESPGQVRLRAERLGALDERLLLASETDLGAVLGLVDAHAPDVLILDSIQTVRHPEVSGLAGGPAQVRECAAALVAAAKERASRRSSSGTSPRTGSSPAHASSSTSSTPSASSPATAITPCGSCAR
jgi:DNA repair protein RadA/Sms